MSKLIHYNTHEVPQKGIHINQIDPVTKSCIHQIRAQYLEEIKVLNTYYSIFEHSLVQSIFDNDNEYKVLFLIQALLFPQCASYYTLHSKEYRFVKPITLHFKCVHCDYIENYEQTCNLLLNKDNERKAEENIRIHKLAAHQDIYRCEACGKSKYHCECAQEDE